MVITNRKEWLHLNFHNDIEYTIFEFISIQFNFHFSIGSWKQNIRIKLKKKISHEGRGMFDNGNGNWCMLGRAFVCRTGHFSVEPGFFVSNHAFCCRTGLFMSNECYNAYYHLYVHYKNSVDKLAFTSNLPNEVQGPSIIIISYNKGIESRFHISCRLIITCGRGMSTGDDDILHVYTYVLKGE